jgi:hypothetical protein
MPKKTHQPVIEYLDMPEHLLNRVSRVADERTGQLFKFWAGHGDLDLSSLLRACYLQGVADGAQVTERGAINGS